MRHVVKYIRQSKIYLLLIVAKESGTPKSTALSPLEIQTFTACMTHYRSFRTLDSFAHLSYLFNMFLILSIIPDPGPEGSAEAQLL